MSLIFSYCLLVRLWYLRYYMFPFNFYFMYVLNLEAFHLCYLNFLSLLRCNKIRSPIYNGLLFVHFLNNKTWFIKTNYCATSILDTKINEVPISEILYCLINIYALVCETVRTGTYQKHLMEKFYDVANTIFYITKLKYR